MCVRSVASVMSDSLQPYGLEPARLMKFSRQESWSQLPCPPPGDLTNSDQTLPPWLGVSTNDQKPSLTFESTAESTAKAAQEKSLDFLTKVALKDGIAVDYLVA